MILCQAVESLALPFFFDLLPGRPILKQQDDRGPSGNVGDHLGSDEVGGEELGGSKRSERPEADPGENGESQSRSMSIGDEPLALMSRLVADLQPEYDPAGKTDTVLVPTSVSLEEQLTHWEEGLSRGALSCQRFLLASTEPPDVFSACWKSRI